ncbi:MAG: rhomboid family intramembrane serine protease [Flavobacteriaceae bacterium]|nr:rhomboid family intramembrane serine protease [Flavobacteriaceae bacterium]
MNFIKDLKTAYYSANIVEKVIYITVFIYLLTLFFTSFTTIWFALPSSFWEFLQKPWTLVSYSLMHHRFIHLLSNVLILYYIGNLFLDFYTERNFLIVYTLGIVVGGITFLITAYLFQTLVFSSLIGASAGVTAVFIAIATKIPRYALQFRFIGSVELWVLATIWVALSILQLADINNGGAVAHLGGAVAGFLYATPYFKDMQLFKKSAKKGNLKTAYKSNTLSKNRSKTSDYQKQIDTILDKISKSGYESLSAKEKEFLFNAGKNN